MSFPGNEQKALVENSEPIDSQPTTGSNFKQIFNPSKLYSNIKIWETFNEILEDNKDYIDQSAILQQFDQEIQSLLKVDHPSNTLQKLVNHIQGDLKYYLLDFLARLLLKEILNQDCVIQKFQEISENSFFDHFFICQESFYDFLFIYKTAVDMDLDFFMQRSNEVDLIFSSDYFSHKKEVEREKRLFKGMYSKFIVSPLAETEDKRNACFSLFPPGTLACLCYEDDVELTLVDKIVILLEVATRTASTTET